MRRSSRVFERIVLRKMDFYGQQGGRKMWHVSGKGLPGQSRKKDSTRPCTVQKWNDNLQRNFPVRGIPVPVISCLYSYFTLANRRRRSSRRE